MIKVPAAADSRSDSGPESLPSGRAEVQGESESTYPQVRLGGKCSPHFKLHKRTQTLSSERKWLLRSVACMRLRLIRERLAPTFVSYVPSIVRLMYRCVDTRRCDGPPLKIIACKRVHTKQKRHPRVASKCQTPTLLCEVPIH